MITFKPITIEDKAEIESFTLPYAPANCDLAFANMFCWQFQFKTAWSVVDGFLVIRFQIGGSDRIGYMQPVGAGDFTPVLRHLEEDILAAGQRLRIIDMTPEGLEKLRSVGHCQFAFASDRNLEDYTTLRTCATFLAGNTNPNATTSTASRRNTNTATSL